jgi:hybrid cluster-associated redox disulfide protein
MATITKDMHVGEIARTWPETRKVFARYGLDLCCGGVHPLEYAAGKHGFDLDQVLAELNAAIPHGTQVWK